MFQNDCSVPGAVHASPPGIPPLHPRGSHRCSLLIADTSDLAEVCSRGVGEFGVQGRADEIAAQLALPDPRGVRRIDPIQTRGMKRIGVSKCVVGVLLVQRPPPATREANITVSRGSHRSHGDAGEAGKRPRAVSGLGACGPGRSQSQEEPPPARHDEMSGHPETPDGESEGIERARATLPDSAPRALGWSPWNDISSLVRQMQATEDAPRHTHNLAPGGLIHGPNWRILGAGIMGA